MLAFFVVAGIIPYVSLIYLVIIVIFNLITSILILFVIVIIYSYNSIIVCVSEREWNLIKQNDPRDEN